MKYVIYGKEYGVFLGECFGLGFWSKLDAAGQVCAPVFDSNDEDHNRIFETINATVWDEAEKLEVVTELVCSATHEECVAAGVEPWVGVEEEKRGGLMRQPTKLETPAELIED